MVASHQGPPRRKGERPAHLRSCGSRPVRQHLRARHFDQTWPLVCGEGHAVTDAPDEWDSQRKPGSPRGQDKGMHMTAGNLIVGENYQSRDANRPRCDAIAGLR